MNTQLPWLIADATRRLGIAFRFLPIAVACSFALNLHALAAVGDLDPAFGTGGKVTTSFGSGNDYGQDIVLQSEGKIVMVGYSFSGGKNDIALARYNADGSLDTSFGPNGTGKVTTDFGNTDDVGAAVALQPDGKILVAGNSWPNGSFVLVRYNANGMLDTSFGTSGKASSNFGGGSEGATAVALQPDGRIVLAGLSNAGSCCYAFALIRFTANGSVDTSFGTSGNGRVITDFSGADDSAFTVAVQPDGKILAAGYVGGASGGGQNSDFALARYNANGTLDTSFGSSGKLTTDIVGTDIALALAVQSDGKIVVVGRANRDGNGDIALLRYQGSGALDTSFGTNGKVTTDFGSNGDAGTAVALQSDGKMLVAGYTSSDFVVARYQSNGSLDTSFGSAGKVTTNFGGTDQGREIALQADGKIVVAGNSNASGTQDFVLARYLTSGAPPSDPPSITAQPQGQTVCKGSSATFQVTATGTAPLAYRWWKDNLEIVEASGPTLTLTDGVSVLGVGLSTSDIKVVVSNASGSVTSQTVRLTVNQPPTITAQPQPRSATAGSAIVLEVTASGTAPFSFQWRKNGASIAGTTDRVLTLSNVQAGDSGSYDVVVGNTCGQVTSQAAALTINPVISAPVIAAQPQPQEVAVGGTVTFNVTATGTAPLAYQWRKDSVDLAGATGPTLTLNNVQLAQAGSYSVRVTNVAESVTSAEARLTVNVPPSITKQPQAQTVCGGSGAAFQVIATGTTPLHFQWRKNGANISSASGSTLTLSNVQASDAAEYTVVVSNPAGTVTSQSARLTVNLPPAISGQPQNKSVTVGNNVLFDVTASGSEPLSYQWFKGGSPIAGATASLLVLRAVQTTDAGNYAVEISNACGKIRSEAAVLTLVVVDEPPRITAQPQSQTVAAGGTATFAVAATGTGQLTFQWKENGANLAGATSATLTLNNVAVTKSGNKYSVVVTGFGSVTSQEATLTVTPVQTGISFITRRLPSGYVPGVALTVTLEVVPPASSASHVVEDQPPAGWTVSNVSSGGAFEAANRKVKFGPFFDTTPRTLTYQVSPPGSESGEMSFSGVGSADGVGSGIGGDAVIKVAQFHPADNKPADWVIAASEITGYGAAWKRGDTWAIGPNPIPSSYVSRAGFLWKNGETYKIDTSVTSGAPLWWVNAARTGQTLRNSNSPVRKNSAPGNSAIRSLPAHYTPGTALTVSIAVTPASDAFSYVVEDQPPTGWTVSSITQGGLFDANNRKVKWGPFFDNTARTLTFQVTPPSSASGGVTFTGLASFDGADVTITGQRSTTVETAPSPLPTVTLAATDASASEAGSDTGAFTVTRTGSTSASLTVNLTISGTASNGTDYTALPASVGIQAGSASANVSVTPIDDVLVEGSETVVVSIATSATYQVGNPGSGTVTIADNDSAPPPTTGGHSAISTLPASYTPGAALTVSLAVTPDSSAFSYVVEDQPPAGWTVSSISQGGLFDASNRKVKWGPFFDNVPRNLTYEVTPPSSTSGEVTFTGIASFDGANIAITGQRSTSTTIVGITAPSITLHPKDQTVAHGELAVFEVVASGTPPLTYQWRFNGANIPGAVSSALIRNSVTVADAGSYGVVVSNAGGQVESASAVLIVRTAQPSKAPTISPIPIPDKMSIWNKETDIITFTLDDDRTSSSALAVVASSSNTSIVPDANIRILPAGAGRPANERRMTVFPAPNRFGEVTLTLTVTDGDNLTAKTTALIRFTAPPQIGGIQNQMIPRNDASAAIAFTVSDTDASPGSLDALKLTADSSNKALIPNSAIIFRGSGANRTVAITPTSNQEGQATITVTITDADGLSASTDFSVSVLALPRVVKVKASADANGAIDPDGRITKTAGESLVFTATPVRGFDVDQWLVDQRIFQNGGTRLTLVNVQADTDVSVTFKPISTETRVLRLEGILAFGDVGAGTTSQRAFTLFNDGNGALTVTGIFYPPGFGGDWSGQIGPGQSQRVTVTFAPQAEKDFGGTVEVASNRTSGSQSLALSGRGVAKSGLTFSDPTPITLRDNAWAAPYPSVIPVFGVNNSVSKVTVTIANLSHSYARDVTVLLVGPQGQKVVLMRKAGGKNSATAGVRNVSLTFDDAAPNALPFGGQIMPGAFRPSDYSTRSELPFPAPSGPYVATLRVFNGVEPNGPWSLFVADTETEDVGAIEAGWSLTFTTGSSTVNTPPRISPIADLTTRKDTPSAQIVFSISDEEDPNSLKVTAVSSNKALVPDSNITTSGFGANRTVVITPASGQVGTAIITLTVTDSGGLAASTSFALTVIPTPRPVSAVRDDFNGDGSPDILFQDRDGSLAIWQMEGANLKSAELLEPSNVGDIRYRIAAVGDFDRDGREDLLFQHADGGLAVWLMDGTRLKDTITLEPPIPDGSGWRVMVADDINGDGNHDLFLQHADGRIEIWMMAGVRRTQRITTSPDSPGDRNWRIAGAGDFNKDQQIDLLFQHTDGTLAVWYLNGSALVNSALLRPQSSGNANLRVVSTADRNRDGSLDLLLQNGVDGTLAIWFMDGINRVSLQPPNPAKPGGTWAVAAPR